MKLPALPRPSLSLVVFGTWAIVLAGMFYLVAKPVREPSLDFYGYYAAASAVHQGRPLYAAETRETIVAETDIPFIGPYTYLPTFAILMQPFALFPPYAASLVWFGVNVGLLVIAVHLLITQSRVRDPRLRAALLLLPVLFTPVLMSLYLGNVNFLVLVLIVLAYQQFVGRRPTTSGAWLALSAWIKVWPMGLIAYFAWKREWKVVSGAVAGLILIGALTVALAGVDQTRSFFTDRLPELLRDTYREHDHLNQSIAGAFAKMFAPDSRYVLPLFRSPALAQLGGRIASFLIVVAAALLCSRPIALRDRKQFSDEFMLVVITTMLVTGWLWDTSLTLLLPAYFLIAEELEREGLRDWRQVALPIGSIVLINSHRVIWTLANPDRQPLPWFLLMLPFFGLILVWWRFAVRRGDSHGVAGLGDGMPAPAGRVPADERGGAPEIRGARVEAHGNSIGPLLLLQRPTA